MLRIVTDYMTDLNSRHLQHRFRRHIRTHVKQLSSIEHSHRGGVQKRGSPCRCIVGLNLSLHLVFIFREEAIISIESSRFHRNGTFPFYLQESCPLYSHSRSHTKSSIDAHSEIPRRGIALSFYTVFFPSMEWCSCFCHCDCWEEKRPDAQYGKEYSSILARNYERSSWLFRAIPPSLSASYQAFSWIV